MSENSSFNEIELLQLCITGNHSVYGQIVERYKTLICSITYSICGDLGKSEDLAQESFIIAWRKLGDLQDLKKFKSWLCTIARNLAKRSLRKRSFHTTELDNDLVETDNVALPGNELIRIEEETLVWQTLEKIPEAYREPMVLFYREEQSIAKVAEAMDLSKDVIKQRLSRGRKMVKEHLAALINSTLTQSRPSKAFTTTIVSAVATMSASSAKAAGTGTVASGTTVAGLGFFSAALAPILLKLPLIGWLIKLQLDSARDEQERRWTIQCFVLIALIEIPLILGQFSLNWEDLTPIGIEPWHFMILNLLPVFVICWRFDRKIRAHRQDWVYGSRDRLELCSHETYLLCIKYLASVLIFPAVLFIKVSDYKLLIAMVILLFFVPYLAVVLHRSFPSRTRLCQILSACIGVPALMFILLVYFLRVSYEEVLTGLGSDYFLWFTFTVQGVIIAEAISIALVWKKFNSQNENIENE